VRRSLAALALAGWFTASGAFSEELVPPPEAGEGDYELERADSLAEGAFETSFSATGTARSTPRRAQALRFRGGGTSGSLREGNDALAGGRLEAPLARGTLRVGRLAPRWGRGLVFGAPAEVWAGAAQDRGEGAAFRGRAGEGAAWAAGERVTVLTGRFARRTVHGARARAGPLSLGGATARGGSQASLGSDLGAASHELAVDGRGGWRAESAWDASEGAVTLSVFARAGTPGYRSLAEPRRTGPARALAARATLAGESGETRALMALWRFAPGADGVRTSLEVHRRLVHHADVLFGFEEQRGTRRDPAYLAGAAATAGMRQGAWCEWHAGDPRARLALRHEWWGERAFVRSAVRRVSVASADAALPGGARLVVTHAAWLARRGERAYLLEDGEDRLVIRAISGAGTRTRCELNVPAMGGRARLSIAIAESGGKTAAPHWTAEWTRRARL
jgi:hypothetical protein